MTEAAKVVELHSGQEKKDLYEVGEIPPLGHVPKHMYAWAIRRDAMGTRKKALSLRWWICRNWTATKFWFW